MRWALAAAVTGASAVAGALAASARHEPARSLLGFAGGVFMKAPAESELDLIQVRAPHVCAVLCAVSRPPTTFFPGLAKRGRDVRRAGTRCVSPRCKVALPGLARRAKNLG